MSPVTNADNSRWAFQYDSLGQVTSGKKSWSDGTAVAGQQFNYGFDDIGNRTNAASGGDNTGANLRSATYLANNLNQYTSRTVPGYINIIGSANSNATVTVWGINYLYARAARHGGYFSAEIIASNTAAAVWLTLTNMAVLNNGTNADIVSTNIGNLFLPQTPETFGFDADGDLTNGGRWTVAWDAENRATSFASLTNTPTPSKKKIDCTYDYSWRRTQKITSTNNGSVYVAQSTNKFVYDGWNLVAILDATNGLDRSIVWGKSDAGKDIPLLLTIYQGANAGAYTYVLDGNYNVVALINAATGTTAGQWDYDPFLGILRATGPLAKLNPLLGSSQFYDWETGLYYYCYRYYDPSTGRWLSRDPIGELGGKNLCAYVGNDAVNSFDWLGLDSSADQFAQNQINKFPSNGTLDQFITQSDQFIDTVMASGPLLGGSSQALYSTISIYGQFSKPIQGNLLHNFLIDKKNPYTMTKQEVLDSQVFFDLGKSKDFASDLKSGSASLTGRHYSVLGGASLTATLGQSFFDSIVDVCIKDGDWSATGTFKVHDTYDFDYNKADAQNALSDYLKNRDPNAGNYQGRHAGGELKTVVMAEVQKKANARPFDVSSVDVPFSQSSKDVRFPYIHIH